MGSLQQVVKPFPPGIHVPCLTWFGSNDAEDIDWELQEQHLRFLITSGLHGSKHIASLCFLVSLTTANAHQSSCVGRDQWRSCNINKRGKDQAHRINKARCYRSWRTRYYYYSGMQWTVHTRCHRRDQDGARSGRRLCSGPCAQLFPLCDEQGRHCCVLRRGMEVIVSTYVAMLMLMEWTDSRCKPASHLDIQLSRCSCRTRCRLRNAGSPCQA